MQGLSFFLIVFDGTFGTNRTAFILDSLILAKNERYDIDDSFHVCYNNEATTVT